MITGARMMDNSVTSSKLSNSAVKRIELAKGELFEVVDSDGFTLLEGNEATKKVSVRGTVGKVR